MTVTQRTAENDAVLAPIDGATGFIARSSRVARSDAVPMGFALLSGPGEIGAHRGYIAVVGPSNPIGGAPAWTYPKKQQYSSRSTTRKNAARLWTSRFGSYPCHLWSLRIQNTRHRLVVRTNVAFATVSSIFSSGFVQSGRISKISTLWPEIRYPRSSWA